jgi:hypothetical protein
VNPGACQACLERKPVRPRGDHHRHAAVPHHLQQVAARLPGQFLLITVELDNVITRTYPYPRNSTRDGHSNPIRQNAGNSVSV